MSDAELDTKLKRLRDKKTAPGPDGVPAKVVALVAGVLRNETKTIIDYCLSEGKFPTLWKNARVVLLPKEGRPAESPSAFCPICLLDEIGKLTKRVIAARLKAHLSRSGRDLSANQFGFRGGLSTIDAILRVRVLSEQITSSGRVALAVPLNMSNAFNILSWEVIRGALEYHEVPAYLRKVVCDYLRDRAIYYIGRGGQIHRREINRGVPQGSILRPFLWDLGYDWILRAVNLPSIDLICYVDDTLVMSRRETWEEATCLAEAGVALVVTRIRMLGLTVALPKTEAMWFAGPRKRGPRRTQLSIEGIDVRIGQTMKYLGLNLDSKWSFCSHFQKLVPRLNKAVISLGRIMPNLGGLRDGARRLYSNAILSITMYGAPMWHAQLVSGRQNLRLMQAAQRQLEIRVIRGYRTVSFEAACVMAGDVPWAIVAGKLTRSHAGKVAAARRAWDLSRPSGRQRRGSTPNNSASKNGRKF